MACGFAIPMACSSISSFAEPQPQTRAAVEINNPGTEYLRKGRRGAPNRDIDTRPRKLGHILKCHNGYQSGRQVLHGSARHEALDRIGDELAAFTALWRRQRSSHAGHGDVRGAGASSHVLEMGNVDQLQMCAERLLQAGLQGWLGILGRHISTAQTTSTTSVTWMMGLHEFFGTSITFPKARNGKSKRPRPTRSRCSNGRHRRRADFLKNYESVAA